MRLVIQRVSEAFVQVQNNIVAQIQQGFLVLLGIESTDTNAEVNMLVKKLIGLRVFEDKEGKMNWNLAQVNGELLIVSQFTLLADCKKGNRPSFIQAARPEQAIPLYELFCKQAAEALGKPVATGIFGADMKVYLLNDGPVTILMDTNEWK